MVATINDIKCIQLPYFQEGNGSLVVLEGPHIPFAIARVFSVKASTGVVRGEHAHKACTQFLTCLNGAVEIHCDDASNSKVHILKDANEGLLIPPGIWARCTYKSEDSVLLVACDRVYESHDYIRSYADFKAYRGVK